MKKQILLFVALTIGSFGYALAQTSDNTSEVYFADQTVDTIQVENEAAVDSLDLAALALDVETEIDSVSPADTTETPIENGAKKKAKKEKVPRKPYGVKACHWSISGNVGIAFLDGDQHQDFNAMWPRSRVQCAFDFTVEYSFNPGFGVYVQYAYNPYNGYANYNYKGLKRSSDGLQPSYSTPFDFDGLAHEVSAGLSLNMLNLFYPQRRQTLGWFVNVGGGFSFYSVNAYKQGTKDILDEKINGVQVAPSVKNGRSVTFPLGTSLEYNPLKWLAISLKAEYRIHAKDNYDGTEKGNANDNTIYIGLGVRWKILNPKDKTRPHVRNMSMRDYLIDYGGANVAQQGENCCDQIAAINERIADLEMLLMSSDSTQNRFQQMVHHEDEIDSDGDGVPDSRDMDNNTPDGAFVNAKGQELGKDQIEKILGYGEYKGETPAIYFETGRTKLSLQSQMELAKIARKLYADPEYLVDIIGYCDNVGGDEINNSLSMHRAEEAKMQLVNRYGISADRITIYGKGKVPGPVDDFEPNRRCDFILYHLGEKEKAMREAEKMKQEQEEQMKAMQNGENAQ